MSTTSEVDAYIEAAPVAAQPLLRQLREAVLSSVEGATEKISYGMPTYEVAGQRLVHLSAAKRHVAVYGLVHADGEVPKELAAYLDHRSTLRFEFNHDLPVAALRAALRSKAKLLSGR